MTESEIAVLQAEIASLQARNKKLAEEKAYNQLILRLLERLNPLSGLDNMISNLLNDIVDTIGGTNISLYYWNQQQIHLADFLGRREIVTNIDDELVLASLASRDFIETTDQAEKTLLQASLIYQSVTWVFPLICGQQLIGIIKLEHIHLFSQPLRYGLPIFFNHVALIMSNEISNFQRQQAEQALRVKTEELNNYFNNALDLFCIADTDGFFRKLNPAWQQTLGYATEELQGQSFYDFIHPEDIAKTKAIIAEYGKQQSISDFVNRYRHKNGHYRWLEWHGQVKDKLIYAAAQDISQRLDMEQKLTASLRQLTSQSARLQTLLDMASDGIHIIDTQGNLVEFSQSFARMLGYSIKETSQLNIFDWEVQLSKENLLSFLGNLKKPTTFETRHRRKDGTIIDVEINACGITLDDQYFVHASSRDITERKRLEASLRASDQRLKTIIKAMPIPMAYAKNGVTIEDINDRFVQVFGYSNTEIPTLEHWWQLAFPEDSYRTQVKQNWNHALKKAVDYFQYIKPLEFNVSCKNQQKRIMEISGVMLGNDILITFVDVSERVKIAENLREAKKVAERAYQAKSEFLANMSHEIRTPMNGIIGLTQLAINRVSDPETHSYLHKIHDSSQTLLGILNDILDYSKIEAGHIHIENTVFDLSTLLNNLRFLFEENARAKHLQFNIEVADNTPHSLIGDVFRLQQVLANLLGNAIKFTPQGSVCIKVQLHHPEHSHAVIRFSVEDTGIGIAAEDIAKLFHPFSQVDSSISRRFGGTGLGLSISQNLLHLMDSELTVKSIPNKGTIFMFDIPLGIGVNPKADTIKLSIASQVGMLSSQLADIGKSLSGCHILVVEDNLINQLVVKEFLKLSGIQVEVADNGEQALEQLNRQAFDAVLMDVHMPIMDGITASNLIRAKQNWQDLPIIALSAGVTQAERDHCLHNGMNDFVGKPIDPEQLITTLKRWVPSPDINLPSTKTPLNRDDWRISTEILEGFSLDNVRIMLGNNHQQFLIMVKDFQQQAYNDIVLINQSLAEHDLSGAEKLIHRLKGVAGNLGAVDLHRACEALDNELKINHLAINTLEHWREVFNHTLQLISELIKLSPSHSQAMLVNPQCLQQSLQKLLTLLENNEFVEETLLAEIDQNLPVSCLKLFECLRQYVHAIDYSNALQTLERIKHALY